jgi:hypothetical protein
LRHCSPSFWRIQWDCWKPSDTQLRNTKRKLRINSNCGHLSN